MGHLTLKIIPGSKREEIKPIKYKGEGLHRPDKANGAPKFAVHLCKPAEKNKANIALLKMLKKITSLPMRIVCGKSKRLKTVEFDADAKDVEKMLKKACPLQ